MVGCNEVVDVGSRLTLVMVVGIEVVGVVVGVVVVVIGVVVVVVVLVVGGVEGGCVWY